MQNYKLQELNDKNYMISCSTGTALVKPRTNIFHMIQRIHLTPFIVMPNQCVNNSEKHNVCNK